MRTVQGLKRYYLDFESLESIEAYEKYFEDHAVLLELSKVPFTMRIIMNILPQLLVQIQSQRLQSKSVVNNVYISRQQIFQTFVHYYYNNEIKRLAHDTNYLDLFDQYFWMSEERDFYDEKKCRDFFEFVDTINHIVSWNILNHQNLLFTQSNVQQMISSSGALVKWIPDLAEVDFEKLFTLISKFSPLEKGPQGYTYIHKSIYEFYVQQSFMKEVYYSRGEPLDPDTSMLGSALLSKDLDILRSIGKDIQYLHNRIKELVIFPCLYSSVLVTRKNKSESARVMASNAITVLNCCDHFEFYGVDFSRCEVPKAILSQGRFENTNFEGCNLEGAQFDRSKISKSNFKFAQMTGCEFGVQLSIKGDFGEIYCLEFSSDGKCLAFCDNKGKVYVKN